MANGGREKAPAQNLPLFFAEKNMRGGGLIDLAARPDILLAGTMAVCRPSRLLASVCPWISIRPQVAQNKINFLKIKSK